MILEIVCREDERCAAEKSELWADVGMWVKLMFIRPVEWRPICGLNRNLDCFPMKNTVEIRLTFKHFVLTLEKQRYGPISRPNKRIVIVAVSIGSLLNQSAPRIPDHNHSYIVVN
jgi:hypothetical protein